MSIVSAIIRGRAGRIIGRLGKGGTEAFDEEAVQSAEAEMYAMAGNAGQISILDTGMDTFVDWANSALEEEGLGDTGWPDVIIDAVGEEQYEGTEIIWSAGFQIISAASGNHDTVDEAGEGTGESF